jgi:uncharacterized membrane-anchored protein YjiN (DUF445 family)
VKSFNKHYNDLKPELHASINNTFKLSEVKKEFERKIGNLLIKIYGEDELPYRFEEQINFVPKEEPYYEINEELKKFLKEDFEDSDLKPIIEKIARDYNDRYKHIEKDEQDNETFRKQ